MRTHGGFVGLLLLASTATAAPIAASLDVDLDGSADTVELSNTGTLTASGKWAGKVELKLAPSKARILVGGDAAHRLLVVDVTAGKDRQAIILGWTGGVWRELARTPLGGVGLDAEYATEIDAVPEGVYRYQVRARAKRCDGKPAYLFAEAFDAAQKRFVRKDKLPSFVDATAPKAPVKLDTAAPAPVVFSARLASHQPGAADAGWLSLPSELDDGKPQTVWREDIAASAGEGQFFTFESRISGAHAKQVRIVPGNPASAAALKASNRPRTLAIIGDKGAARVELPDAAKDPLGSAYLVELPQPLGECVTVVLESTYGPERGATAIAELSVYADGERAGGGEAMLARLVAEGGAGSVNATAALVRSGLAGANALEAELQKTTDLAPRRRLIAALVKINESAAAPSLVRAAREGWVRGTELVEVIEALARLGLADELAELAAQRNLERDARLAALGGISVDDKGLPHLLALAGDGSPELRRAVIERLTAVPKIETLIDAAQRETDARAAGDLWRAVTRRARATKAERPTAVAAMTAAFDTATDYDRRYRLVEGIATLAEGAELRLLETQLRALPAGAQRSAFLQVAVSGMASSPRPSALPFVLALADDPDPGVRLAVLGALAGVEDDPASPWHTPDGPEGIDRVLISALSADRWPDVRRRAANALGTRCQRQGPAYALTASVLNDKDLMVRGDALIALVQCHAPGIAQLLPKLWDDSNAPTPLRSQAVGLAAALGDPKLGPVLVTKFRTWRGGAIESEAALALAQAAPGAIAELAPPGAAEALLDALDDSAFPEIVRAAAFALGTMGPRCPAAAKRKLNELARSDEQSAQAAKAAVAKCTGR
ncbi:MAG: HEAT repeat domain-containing protein [Kofleriaceae bacterium]|nr:HEAT repeat domain-containing protein [Kofleriaceae bacterium]